MKLHRLWKTSGSQAVWILAFSFAVSAVTLGVYIAESDYSDKTLFFLLVILRYSSFLVFICSIFLLTTGIYRLIRKPSPLSVMRIVLSFCSALYGAGIIIVDAFIISITGGM